jgi:hypothetical protein
LDTAFKHRLDNTDNLDWFAEHINITELPWKPGS